MKKERMITRTITTAEVSVMVVVGREVQDVTYDVGSVTGLTEEGIIAKAKKCCPDHCIYVKTNKIFYTDYLYGMSEADFIKYGEILPPRKG